MRLPDAGFFSVRLSGKELDQELAGAENVGTTIGGDSDGLAAAIRTLRDLVLFLDRPPGNRDPVNVNEIEAGHVRFIGSRSPRLEPARAEAAVRLL
jgi:hypothetical protein